MPFDINQYVRSVCVGLTLLMSVTGYADEMSDTKDACILNEIRNASSDTTVAELRKTCAVVIDNTDRSLLRERYQREQAAEQVGTVLTPHKQNYMMPASYLHAPNNEPYRQEFGELLANEKLDNVEAKFQLSMKFTLASNFLFENDTLYAGFTILSFWQVYNRSVSSPFRETNYEPELYWTVPLKWHPFDVDASEVSLGFSHQSNGRGGTLSRSWNRVYADFTWEKNNFVFKLKPWWRVTENEKDSPGDANGDDNPDIEKYMGHFEFTTVYKRGNQEFSFMLRNNLRDENKGAVQLDWTFPLWRRLRGYAQYFNGYGESLVDYDARIQRIGLGILLTDRL